MNSKSKLFFGLLLVGLFFSANSCQKEEDNPNESINNQIEGDWDVTSFTLDGVEQMKFSITSFQMDFKKEYAEGGETDWLLIGTNGNTTELEGDYEIQNSGTEIDVDGDDLNLDLDGDELKLSGNIDGQRWEIEADRD